MREIKFRAYNPVTKKIIYYEDGSGHYVVAFNGEIQKLWHGNTPFNVSIPVGLELMQFTGLYDKNGKEIYEGDILREDEFIGEVVFYNGAFEVKWDENIFDCIYPATSVIIGNKFQQPELLEE